MKVHSVDACKGNCSVNRRMRVQDLLETLLNLRLSKGFLRDVGSILGRIILTLIPRALNSLACELNHTRCGNLCAILR